MLCKIGQLKGTFYKSQVFLADKDCISDSFLRDFYVRKPLSNQKVLKDAHFQA